jgi:hypothetical protein
MAKVNGSQSIGHSSSSSSAHNGSAKSEYDSSNGIIPAYEIIDAVNQEMQAEMLKFLQQPQKNGNVDAHAKEIAAASGSTRGYTGAGKRDLTDVVKFSKSPYEQGSLENKTAIEYMVLEFQRAGGSNQDADKLRSALSRIGTGTYNKAPNTNDSKIVNAAIQTIDTAAISGNGI